MSKDRTPAEIKAVRREREIRRTVRVSAVCVLWLVLFTAGAIIGSMWLLWGAFLLSMGNLAVLYGLHERALRKIADRPAPDYQKIHKLAKEEEKTRPAITSSEEKT